MNRIIIICITFFAFKGIAMQQNNPNQPLNWGGTPSQSTLNWGSFQNSLLFNQNQNVNQNNAAENANQNIPQNNAANPQMPALNPELAAMLQQAQNFSANFDNKMNALKQLDDQCDSEMQQIAMSNLTASQKQQKILLLLNKFQILKNQIN
jgi:hypothetical protein